MGSSHCDVERPTQNPTATTGELQETALLVHVNHLHLAELDEEFPSIRNRVPSLGPPANA